MAGADSYHHAYQQQIRRLKLKKSVLLIGSRQDVPRILRCAQVGALATENEGFGLVILEYLAAGIPVATTDIPPIREMVQHDREALLSPTRRPDMLATNIERLLCDSDLADRRCGAGSQ